MNEPPKLYCPRCNDLFHVPPGVLRSTIDGCFFGTTFAHLLILDNPKWTTPPSAAPEKYIPRIFGFKIFNAKRHNQPTSFGFGSVGVSDVYSLMDSSIHVVAERREDAGGVMSNSSSTNQMASIMTSALRPAATPGAPGNESERRSRQSNKRRRE